MPMRNWQANLLGAGVATGVVAAGLFLGAPDVAASGPSNPTRLATPAATAHGSGEVPIGDMLEMWGQPSQLNMFWTNDSADEVARTYSDAWKAAGFEPRTQRIDRVVNVSFVETTTGLMRTVTIMEAGDQRVVLPGLTDIRVAPDTTPDRSPVPVPEGASGFVAHTADDSGSVAYNASYAAPIASDTIIAFYRAEMTRLGYTERANPEVRKVPAGAAIEFERGPEFVQIIASGNDAAKLEKVREERKLTPEQLSGKASFVTLLHVRKITQAGAKETP
jgi:hypothetical protein